MSGSTLEVPGEPKAGSANSRKDTNNEKLMVALRIRPLRQEEKQKGFQIIAEKVDDKMVVLLDPSARDAKKRKQDVLRKKRSSERQYLFDAAFGADSTQEEVYQKTTKPLVDSVLQGYNACIFAYGATGAGKTHTMVGTRDNPGCMVMALNDLFRAMDSEEGEIVFKVTMSYLEIYNENIRDLLNPSSGYLDLREDSKGKNIQVSHLSEAHTNSTDEVMRLLHRGNKERTQEPTAANKTSSRSHALLMVNVKQTNRTRDKGAVKTGTLYMIDLAGSERAAQTQNRGKRLKEGAHINRSLLALGNCINALAEGRAKYVNFRDSKLTRLLKDALSGNCQTVMVAHISPADRHRDESRNTLVYADRAKNISNKVRRNVLDVSYHVSQYQNIISELRHEIGRLKEKIQAEGNITGKGLSKSLSKKQAEELRELRDDMVTNFREQMKLRNQLMKIDNHILALSMEFEKNNLIINEYENEKAKTMKRSRRRRGKKERKGRKGRNGSTGDDNDDDDDDGGKEEENEESGFEEDDANEGATSSTSLDKQDSENNAENQDESSEASDEPEEVKVAWEELILIQKEQERYAGIKMDLEQDLEECKKTGKKLEDELPKRISTEEESEILSLLLKVHELEIEKVEMQSNALLKEYEVRRRDLLIIKYDKQRSLSDEIIERQRQLIEAMEANKQNGSSLAEGNSMPMPAELSMLYDLYQQELETRENNEKEALLVSEAKEILRTPSMLSLRPELDEPKMNVGYDESNRLPPIRQETPGEHSERLFESRTDLQNLDDLDPPRSESRLSLRSPESSAGRGRSSPLPPIDGGRRRRGSNAEGGDGGGGRHNRSSSSGSAVRTGSGTGSGTNNNNSVHFGYGKPLPPISGQSNLKTLRRSNSFGISSRNGPRPDYSSLLSAKANEEFTKAKSRIPKRSSFNAPLVENRSSSGDIHALSDLETAKNPSETKRRYHRRRRISLDASVINNSDKSGKEVLIDSEKAPSAPESGTENSNDSDNKNKKKKKDHYHRRRRPSKNTDPFNNIGISLVHF